MIDSIDSILSWIGAAVVVTIITAAIVLGVNVLFDKKLFKASAARIKTIFVRV